MAASLRRKFRLRTLAIVSVLSSASLVISLQSIPALTQSEARPDSASTEISVAWLVLDEAPLYALLNSRGDINERRFPGFAMLAKNSTWYRNTLGTAQRTTEAVPALLDGKWPTLRNYPVFKDHPVNLFSLTNGKKDLDVFQSVTRLCPPNVCPNRVPGTNNDLEIQIAAFRNFTRNASQSTAATVHFAHVLLPHRPWRFSTDLRLVRELPIDPRRNTVEDRRRDSYQALVRQFVATDTLLLELLTTLKQSQNWNRTMLVVTADHGMTLVPGESYRDTVNPENPGTLEDIYRVPLFIKYPNQTTASVSDCPVSSIDILPTVISVAKIPHQTTFDGVDLSSTCPNRSTRRVQWPYTGIDLSTSFIDVLSRVDFYNKWIAADGDVDDIHRVGRSGGLLGTSAPTAGIQSNSKIVWTNIDPQSFSGIGKTELSYVPARVSGRVTTSSALCEQCEGILVVDGTIVASIPELAGLTPSQQSRYFTTSLMTSFIKPSSSPPELWIVDWTTGNATFTRIGPPLD